MRVITVLFIAVVAIFFVACGGNGTGDLQQQVTDLQQQVAELQDADVNDSELEERITAVEESMPPTSGTNMDRAFGDGVSPWNAFLSKQVLAKKALEIGDEQTARALAVNMFAELGLYCGHHLLPDYILPSEIVELVDGYVTFEEDDSGHEDLQMMAVRFDFPFPC